MDDKDKRHFDALMLIIVAAACVVFGWCMSGCSAKRAVIVTPANTETRTVETRVETVFVSDTLFVEIPAQTAERTTRDSSSILENDYSVSVARVDSVGELFHSLVTKARVQPVAYSRPVERKDSIIYIERTEQVPYAVETEKALTWRQRVAVKFFPVVLVALFAAVLWMTRKKWLALFRKLLR